MCGIAGRLTWGGGVEQGLVEAICAALGHRGPDDSGTYFDHGAGLSVGLGARRLSIIDLTAAGHQPMSNETEDIWICYNGEVYNHLELRRELEGRGHTYRSRTDTETVIHAYEEYGVGCLERLNGMFAFALYDRARQRLLLARDRMGVKPLYYAWDGQGLLFASELKALLAGGRVSRAVNPTALSLYLSLGYVPAPYCLLEGVAKLRPGSYLLFEKGVLSTHLFWSAERTVPDDNAERDGDLAARTRSTVERAVKRQLMSDVPVGVFLSGGVDSTIIANLGCRFSSRPVDTFSVGFADSQGSVDPDSPYNQDLLHARSVARWLGTRHHEVLLRDGTELEDLLRSSMVALDEPTWEASFVSLNLMARLARQEGVPVVLTGDGGDELFGGYPWYGGARKLEVYERLPGLGLVLPLLGALGRGQPLGAKARDLGRKRGQSNLTKYRLNHEIFSPPAKQALLTEEIRRRVDGDPVDDVLRLALGDPEARSFSETLALADLCLWVREHFNQRLDRMTMLHSVEGRVPFQDDEVVDLALSIPLRLKCKGGEGKALLRQACRDLLPEAVLRRPKRPFAVPAWTWLRGPLRGLATDALSESRVSRFGLLEPNEARSISQAFFEGDDSLIFKTWTLLALQLWGEGYLAD